MGIQCVSRRPLVYLLTANIYSNSLFSCVQLRIANVYSSIFIDFCIGIVCSDIFSLPEMRFRISLRELKDSDAFTEMMVYFAAFNFIALLLLPFHFDPMEFWCAMKIPWNMDECQ